MDILEAKSFAKEIEKMSFFKFIPRTFKAIGSSAKVAVPLAGLGGAGAFIYGATKLPQTIDIDAGT